MKGRSEYTLSKFFRFVPVYATIIFFDATVALRILDGPIWNRVTESEKVFCRKNWWANLLFINNYVTANEPVGILNGFLGVTLTKFHLFSVFNSRGTWPQISSYLLWEL